MAELKAFTMPKWGIEMAEGTVAEWMAVEGAPFTRGDVLTLIETDKITNEVEAEADGCFVRVVAKAGETYPVGALLAVMGPADAPTAEIEAFIGAFRPADTGLAAVERDEGLSGPVSAAVIPDGVAISPAARERAQSAHVDPATIAGSGRGGRITRQDVDRALKTAASPILKGPIDAPGQEQAFASPLARRLAAQNGVDLSEIVGTGGHGRICRLDVETLIGASASPNETERPNVEPKVEIVSMSSMRRTIAARLTEAKQTIPHFYLRRRVRTDRLIGLREQRGKGASLNDYLVRATALALRAVPEVNIQVHGHEIHRFASADIAVAVATPRGLITPILRMAEALSVDEIGQQLRELAERARAGKLQHHEFSGGSFGMSNLGMFGVEQFDAIINPPQGAILAIGAARPEPIDDGGAIRIAPVLHLSLSCDHRAIDGADGARFLSALADLIEAPERL